MSPEYEARPPGCSVKFLERGYVYKGLRPVYWCIHDQTALAEAEVEYKEHTSPSVYVKFPLQVGPGVQIDGALAGKNVFFVIWTTTPWTLPANLGNRGPSGFRLLGGRERSGDEVISSSCFGSCGARICATPTAGFGGVRRARAVQGLEARPARSKTRLARPRFADDERRARHARRRGGRRVELDVRFESKAQGKSGTGCVHTAPGHGARRLSYRQGLRARDLLPGR
jgi:hypothetical protein